MGVKSDRQMFIPQGHLRQSKILSLLDKYLESFRDINVTVKRISFFNV